MERERDLLVAGQNVYLQNTCKMPVNYKATAALMGGTGVIMGAFGAHALKALLTVSARAAQAHTA